MKNTSYILVSISALLIAASVSYYFVLYLPSHSLVEKQRCAQDGEKWVADRYPSPENLVDLKYFAFASDLHTCLADVELLDTIGTHRGIYDIYSNKLLASWQWDRATKSESGDLKQLGSFEEKYFGK